MQTKLIAPCGMNCGTCLGYLREKNKCPGCRLMTETNSDYIRKCIIKHCEILKKNKMDFCSPKCEKYPCKRLKSLDKRYRTRYKISMVENLENIEKLGVEKFVKNEEVRWMCHGCNGTLCVHRNFCLFCGEKRK